MRPSPIILFTLLAFAPCTFATENPKEDPAEVFDSLYGSRVKAVRQTRDHEDNIELAGKLIESTESTDSPQFTKIACDIAYDLSIVHPEGYDTAIRAMNQLARIVPRYADEASSRIIDVRLREYRIAKSTERGQLGRNLIPQLTGLAKRYGDAGNYDKATTLYRQAMVIANQIQSPASDGLKKMMQTAQRIGRAKKRIRELEAKSRATLTDEEAVELVLLYLVQLDDPVGAAKHVAGTRDEKLRNYVPLAAHSIERAPVGELLGMGNWFLELASKHKDAQVAMLQRAHDCFERLSRAGKLDAGEKKEVAALLDETRQKLSRHSEVYFKEGEIKRFTGHIGRVYCASFSPDGRLAISGGGNGSIMVWDVREGMSIQKINGHRRGVSLVRISRDGRYAMSVSIPGRTVKAWVVRSGRQVHSFPHGVDVPGRFDMSDDGRWMATSDLRSHRIVDLRSKKTAGKWGGAGYAATISPDGQFIAWGAGSPVANIRNRTTGKTVSKFRGSMGKVYAIDFSGDGNVLAAGGPAGHITVWNIQSKKEMSRFRMYTEAKNLSLSRNGHRLISQGRYAHVWDTVKGEEIYTIQDPNGRCSLSPDGKTALVPMGQDVVLWGLP